MPVSTRLVDLIGLRIDEFLTERGPTISAIATELNPFIDYSTALLSGGKRFRALFCYWGWNAVGAGRDGFDPLEALEPPRDLAGVIDVASGLELFHAAALVHDDIMDSSDTRRGMPAAHRRFAELHAAQGWTGSGAAFGTSGALLLGDLLLGWSDELIEQGLALLDSRAAANAARSEFNRMRTEVTVGQYLDILEERSWRSSPESEQLARAHRVLVYKSAKYSVEAPLTIGAAMGGASEPQLAALRAFGLPLGIAYQLRDDMLGVFGDPAVTGKPAGDDLREGKRTVLIALARAGLPANAVRLLDELLGDPQLNDDQIRMLQATLVGSGAVEKVERMISHNVGLAREALD
ncbi:MAG TPA: polyprenyl synthetase family protein, partial [Galbitalea sp.]